MRTIKHLIAVLLVVALLFALAGCTIVNPQRMYRVKGTYKLTDYTVSPQGEEREGAAPRRIDYIADEDRLYEDYLIVTGQGTGYYVHKAAGEAATVQEISLSYQYAEGGKKIEYVSYGDTESESPHGGIRLSVSKHTLAYSKLSIRYTEPFTGRKMSTEGISVRFERISSKTDLSYAEKALGVALAP